MNINIISKKGIVISLFCILFLTSIVNGVSINTEEVGDFQYDMTSFSTIMNWNLSGNRNREGDNWNIVEVGTCPTTYKAFRVVAQGDYVYMTTWNYLIPRLGTLDVINISNPENPWVEGTLEGWYYENSFTNFEILCDIVVQGDHVYFPDITAIYQGHPSCIFKARVTDPSHPVLVAIEPCHSGNARAVAVQDEYVYAAEWGDPGLSTYSISDLSFKGHCGTSADFPNEIAVRGDYAYIAEYDPFSSLTIVDISDPEWPFVVGCCKIGDNQLPPCVSVPNDRYAYMADCCGLQIINITDPYDPVRVFYYDDPEWCSFVQVVEDFAYITVEYGIEILNISNPEDPVRVGYYNSPGACFLSIQGDYIYVANWEEGFKIFQHTWKNGWPDKPLKPTGTNWGEENIDYTFSANTTDPQGDQLFYQWRWGDGTTSDWLGPFNSGETIQTTHNWTETGDFDIQVRAKDIHEIESEWSEPLAIHIAAPEIQIERIIDGIGVTAIIKNVGDADATSIEWSIIYDGGFIMYPRGGIKEGTFEHLSVGEERPVQVTPFGIGGIRNPIEITVTARESSGRSDSKTVEGSVFFIFVQTAQ